MAHVDLIQYEQATKEVKEVFDDIKNLRKIPDVNNFWKCLANHPPTLKRTWESLKEVMAPGVLDSLTKELIYVAVSASNGCEYCIHSHTAAARKQGMTDEMFGELMAVVGMANENNRLVHGYQVPLDPQFRKED
jgi:AhpD family alkylhydroperoxidase